MSHPWEPLVMARAALRLLTLEAHQGPAPTFRTRTRPRTSSYTRSLLLEGWKISARYAAKRPSR